MSRSELPSRLGLFLLVGLLVLPAATLLPATLPEDGALSGLGMTTPSAEADDADDKYKEALKQMKAYKKRPSLTKRMVGRELLAKTKHDKALDRLIKDYKRAEKPEEAVESLITMLIAEYFQKKRLIPVLKKWREDNDKPEHAYIWYRTLLMQTTMGMHDEVMALAADPKANGYHRGAALRALAESYHRPALKELPTWLKALPRDEIERSVMLANAGWLMISFMQNKRDEDFKKAGNALLDQVEDDSLPHHGKLSIIRQVAFALGSSPYTLDTKIWRKELEVGGSGSGKQDARYVSFGGLRASGDRIAYVIDLSDSMMTPLTSTEKEDGSPETNRGGGLDWSKIENRFDLARELLRASIEKLPDSKSFSVAWFGDKAELFAATNGMVQATDRNKKKFFRELDAISAGAVKPNRPHGTLRGATNLHGGILRGFRMKDKGMLDKYSYVDKKTILEGADSMFILSDGAPTADDNNQKDTLDAGDTVGDPEGGMRSNQRPKEAIFLGPFSYAQKLVEDIKRMNLYRNVEIHGLGIGEANMGLLQALAKTGLGQTRKIGGARSQ